MTTGVSKPRLLDLMCGAGGCTKGYQRAGFYVVGVDHIAQPRYCGDEFHQADALTFPMAEFAAIHASPPCQHYANVTGWGHRFRKDRSEYADLIAPIRSRLQATGLPYIIENVRTTELREPWMLCASWFGLKAIRHRYFETSFPLPLLNVPCNHTGAIPFDHGSKHTESEFRDAIGCDWMTAREARQAVPPAMTEWIGAALLKSLSVAA